MIYRCHAVAPSTITGALVYRERDWPMGARGPMPVVPFVPRQPKRGPRNVLIHTAQEFVVVPMRTLRKE
jgi:hypothetical protein